MAEMMCEDCLYFDQITGFCNMYKQIANSNIVSCNQFKSNHINSESEDNVNHPSHYCQDGGMECIDEMIAVFGVFAVKYFCLCNVWKYRKRALYKNGKEDMEKADWYMKKFVELGDQK